MVKIIRHNGKSHALCFVGGGGGKGRVHRATLPKRQPSMRRAGKN